VLWLRWQDGAFACVADFQEICMLSRGLLLRLVGRSLAVCALAVPVAVLPGCIIVAKTTEPEYVVVPAEAQQTANWASIRAARGIANSGERRESLISIAQRGDLTQSEQLAIVDAATTGRMASRDATQVLTAIVSNPTTTIETRNALASNLRRADLSSSDRKAVTDALIATTPASK
jgi:hypothetical protein